MRRRAWIVCAATLAAAAGAAGAVRATGDVAALRDCGGAPAPLQQGAGYRYVILQAREYRRIPAIKRRFPGVKVLAYKDMASTRDYSHDANDLPTGVAYDYANRRHPEWFLKDTTGHRVEWRRWPGSWQMDVGSASYQATWERNVADELRRHHWDGVFVDGIVRTMKRPAYLGGRVLAKYPGADDYTRATTSFLRRVGPHLRSHLLVVGNVNDAELPLWKQWVGYMSGASKEWWTKAATAPGANYLTASAWWWEMRLLQAAQERGKIFVAISYGKRSDLAAMAYARASFLLFSDGGHSAFTYSAGCAGEPAAGRWRQDLGSPQGKASHAGAAWLRRFGHGIVVVNPTPGKATAGLGGTYLGPDGTRVERVRLAPHSALMLRRP